MNRIRKQGIMMLLIVTIACFFMTSQVHAASENDYKDSADNYYFSSQDAQVKDGIFFSGFGVGKDLSMENCDSQDTIALAGLNLSIQDSKVGGSTFLAGYNIQLSGCDIQGNVAAASNSLRIDQNTKCNGVIAAAKDITFEGQAKSLQATGQKVILTGKIDGDVNVEADQIEIAQGAIITGTLTVKAKEEPKVDEGAQVGKIAFEKITEKTETEEQVTKENMLLQKIKSILYWSAAMALMGLLMVLLGRKHIVYAPEVMREKPVATMVFGLIAFLLTPIACLLMMLTVIGIPLAIITAMFYIIIIIASLAFTGASLGAYILRKIPMIPAALIGIVILECLKKIPYLGIIVGLAACLYTMGYLIQYISNSLHNKE